jgi:hypothetical protein
MFRSQGDTNAAVAVLVINQKCCFTRNRDRYSVISEQRHRHRTDFFLTRFNSVRSKLALYRKPSLYIARFHKLIIN